MTFTRPSLCSLSPSSSAGIGRTGVVILMETALCLMETNQPVYPLDTVRLMRDQRLGMIQTAVSHRRRRLNRQIIRCISFSSRVNINSHAKPFCTRTITAWQKRLALETAALHPCPCQIDDILKHHSDAARHYDFISL